MMKSSKTVILMLLITLLLTDPTHSSPNIIKKINVRMQRFIMRMVRDIGRHKARKRRFITSEQYGLVSVLLQKDDTTTEAYLNETLNDDMDLISIEELAGARGGDDDPRLWIAVMGYVFDVSAGTKFYGVGGAYHDLTGRDATFALALGDLSFIGDKVNGKELSKGDGGEARRWLEYFVGHDKYIRVGRLPRKTDAVVDLDALVEQEIDATEEIDDLDEEKKANNDAKEDMNVPKWHPKVSKDMEGGNCVGSRKKAPAV